MLFILVFGRCLFVKDLGHLRDNQFIKFNLKSDKQYQMFLHDPRFFVFTLKPLSVPVINLNLNMPKLIPDKINNSGVTPIAQQWIHAVKNVKLNRKQAPCVEDINYSFTSCIIDHIVKSTNCTVRNEMKVNNRNPFPFFQYNNQLKEYELYEECQDLEMVEKHFQYWWSFISTGNKSIEPLLSNYFLIC